MFEDHALPSALVSCKPIEAKIPELLVMLVTQVSLPQLVCKKLMHLVGRGQLI